MKRFNQYIVERQTLSNDVKTARSNDKFYQDQLENAFSTLCERAQLNAKKWQSTKYHDNDYCLVEKLINIFDTKIKYFDKSILKHFILTDIVCRKDSPDAIFLQGQEAHGHDNDLFYVETKNIQELADLLTDGDKFEALEVIKTVIKNLYT